MLLVLLGPRVVPLPSGHSERVPLKWGWRSLGEMVWQCRGWVQVWEAAQSSPCFAGRLLKLHPPQHLLLLTLLLRLPLLLIVLMLLRLSLVEPLLVLLLGSRALFQLIRLRLSPIRLIQGRGRLCCR